MKLDYGQQKVMDAAVRELKYVRKTVALFLTVAGLMLLMGWHWNLLIASNFSHFLVIFVVPLAALLFHVYRTLSAITQLLQELVSSDPQALAQQISRHSGESDAEGLRP